MKPPETERFTANGFEVTVTETPGALRYTFAIPGGQSAGQWLATHFWWVNVVLAGVGIAVAYALVTHGAGKPAWVIVLSWLFVAQTLGMAGLGVLVLARQWLLSVLWRAKRMEMVFTREAFLHRTGGEADGPVCPLAEVRGFRVFLSGGEERLGALSVVVGDARQTHGIFGGSVGEDMVTLARHLDGRLTAFRSRRGLTGRLDPVDVVEASEEEAAAGSHTLPARPGGLLGRLFWRGWWVLAVHPMACSVWFFGICAGAVGSAVVLAAAGMPAGLAAAAFVVLFHGVLVVAAWRFRANEPRP